MTEPAIERVEAAARAIHKLTQGDPFEEYHPSWQEARRVEARAALAAVDALAIAAAPAPQQPTCERCEDCGDKLDYVAGMDGQGYYPHCWRCWYKEHPGQHEVNGASLPYVTRVTLAGRAGPRSAEHWDYEGVGLSVEDDGRTLKVIPLPGGVT